MIERTAYTMMEDYRAGIKDIDKRILSLEDECQKVRSRTKEYWELRKRIASLDESRTDMMIALHKLKRYYGNERN